MARGRPGALELARLLDAVAQPAYVLDEDRAVVFCNRACLEWLGCAPDAVQQKRCVFGSDESGKADPAVAGLCPPPGVLAGEEGQAVASAALADGRLSRRRVRFVPLRGDGTASAAILAIVESQDLNDTEAEQAPVCSTEAAQLHERLRKFRHQRAAFFRLDRFVGGSTAMRRVRAQVEVAAASRASVLIVGPPGSGRQHAAHAIHYGPCGEPGGPLVPLACAVSASDLITSTLEAISLEGQFRSGGPTQSSPCHGTLLLNDVDQLPPESQAELAKELTRPGFPLRIVATASQDLLDSARKGQFREDLATVLSTLVIQMPALAERRGDVPLLAQLFVEESNARGGKQIAGLSSEALDCLEAYPWPGNVDELARMIHEAHQRAEATEIVLGDLPEQVHHAYAAAGHPRRPEEKIVLGEFLPRIERELLARALARAKGNKTKAARLLGMTRPRFYRRLVQLGLEKPPS
jgi:DNA-binding NtrC family response regulator